MEQAKQFDPDFGKDGDEDDFEAALNYMEAVGGGLNLQIGRGVSMGGDLSSDRALSLLSPSLSQPEGMLLEGSSVHDTPLRDESTSATQHIQHMARTAQHLMRHQAEIERKVTERWSAASGAPAGGGGGNAGILAVVPAFQLDSWGKFRFVLARITDRQGRQKLLVRGSNGCEEDKVFRMLEQEVAATAVQQRQPGPRLELLGTGVMEWSRDHDSCLKVSGTKVHSFADARLQSKEDVALLAGTLAQSSLPANFKVDWPTRPPHQEIGLRNGT